MSIECYYSRDPYFSALNVTTLSSHPLQLALSQNELENAI